MEKDIYTKKWIIENSLEIIDRYEKGMLTLRALHYQLVSIGMTNTLRHYKRVVNAMIDARWDNLVDFDAFSDHDREMIGFTEYESTNLDDKVTEAKQQLKLWMTSYSKNRWENQPNYVEVLIEKKALQGVFERPCRNLRVAMGACKGYPSLTFLNELKDRFLEAIDQGKHPVIIYFGDYDPSGEDIPRSIEENMIRFGVYGIEVKRIALMEHQVIEWKLPPAPIKEGDSRSAKWDGLGQVELDAVKPEQLQSMCTDAISELFDQSLYDELLDQEEFERTSYQVELRTFVNNSL